SALGIAVNMLVAVFMVHGANGFFMNWMGNQKGEGFEYHILALGLASIVMVAGGGKWSVDSLFGRTSVKHSLPNHARALPADLEIAGGRR
ncbi:MAG TPA: DoxX family protein, partial [Verrucomicrobiae bacterium]|nr:DoxX family protein [Verrucomicrobiae bacterium]